MPSLVGTVSETWRYPIKSLGGLGGGTLDLDERGVRGDRALAVYGSDGKIGSGKSTRRFRRMDGLLQCTARAGEAGQTLLAMPGGDEYVVPSEAANEALSKLIGEPVRVQAEDAISHFDVAPIHIVTSASLEWLARRIGVEEITSVRFRPNLVLETPDAAAHVEDAWVGCRLRVGGAVLEVTEPTERCVMVGMRQPGFATDERILRVIASEHDACLGVYATVVAAGAIRPGDRVHLER